MDYIQDAGQKQPGQQNGNRKGNIGDDVGASGNSGSVELLIRPIGKSPDDGQVENEQQQKEQGRKGRYRLKGRHAYQKRW